MMNNPETLILIFIGLCQLSYETRGRAHDLMLETRDFCNFTKQSHIEALYLTRSMIPDIDIEGIEDIPFRKALNSTNMLLYCSYFSAFVNVLYKKDKETTDRLAQTLIKATYLIMLK